MSERVISVFGSSVPQPGSSEYALAYEVGRRLAQAGYAVATGGYGGVMMGVSQGAAEAGGRVVGVTCAPIAQMRPQGPNRWVQQEIQYVTLEERVAHLVRHNVGMIALPGGIGTLAELAMAWNLLLINEIEQRPFVAVGSLWRQTLGAFFHPLYVQDAHRALLSFADSAETAVAHVLSYAEKQAVR